MTTDKKQIFTKRETHFFADMFSVLSIYQQVRNHYSKSMLLESTDYHTGNNSKTYICFDELASLSIEKKHYSFKFFEKNLNYSGPLKTIEKSIREFRNNCVIDDGSSAAAYAMFFGYSAFDAVTYFDKIPVATPFEEEIPEMYYSLFRFVIEINHFTKEAKCMEYIPEGEAAKIDQVLGQLLRGTNSHYTFSVKSDEDSYTTEEEFFHQVAKAREHCFQGDVFQLVLSRRFSVEFEGDDFQFYRALRSVNPSPYLFYYDHGDFHLMGSSPEAQLIVEDGKAEIHPIAGTFRRSGNDAADRKMAEALLENKKENAEHLMLVDLARNDLSRFCSPVEVKKLREIQFYSHVIHMVSKVTGELITDDMIGLLSYTFPAGTLSGAPKFHALELIHQYENHARGFYGGCIGMTDFSRNNNQAIMIRTVLSKGNRLFYQAGAGIVADSEPESELQEINNKLGAIRQAIHYAQKIKG